MNASTSGGWALGTPFQVVPDDIHKLAHNLQPLCVADQWELYLQLCHMQLSKEANVPYSLAALEAERHKQLIAFSKRVETITFTGLRWGTLISFLQVRFCFALPFFNWDHGVKGKLGRRAAMIHGSLSRSLLWARCEAHGSRWPNCTAQLRGVGLLRDSHDLRRVRHQVCSSSIWNWAYLRMLSGWYSKVSLNSPWT